MNNLEGVTLNECKFHTIIGGCKGKNWLKETSHSACYCNKEVRLKVI